MKQQTGPDLIEEGCEAGLYMGWEEVLDEKGRKWSGSVNEKVHKGRDVKGEERLYIRAHLSALFV